jgi:hypothetical protein
VELAEASQVDGPQAAGATAQPGGPGQGLKRGIGAFSPLFQGQGGHQG